MQIIYYNKKAHYYLLLLVIIWAALYTKGPINRDRDRNRYNSPIGGVISYIGGCGIKSFLNTSQATHRLLNKSSCSYSLFNHTEKA